MAHICNWTLASGEYRLLLDADAAGAINGSACMQEASDKGFFRPNGKPDFSYILTAAADIAAGMAYLHSRGIAHGDLTGGNVLLASDSSSFSGVVAKVADFGLARAMDVKSKIETRTYGTVTHMPPELLEKGIFSKVSLTSFQIF